MTADVPPMGNCPSVDRSVRRDAKDVERRVIAHGAQNQQLGTPVAVEILDGGRQDLEPTPLSGLKILKVLEGPISLAAPGADLARVVQPEGQVQPVITIEMPEGANDRVAGETGDPRVEDAREASRAVSEHHGDRSV